MKHPSVHILRNSWHKGKRLRKTFHVLGVGVVVGDAVGVKVGAAVGLLVGLRVGEAVGFGEGVGPDDVGAGVGVTGKRDKDVKL